jgi:anhydro-N-acetylmuramic acid kinase
MTEFTIGLMSGTSADGVDGVVLACQPDRFKVKAFSSIGFPAELRRTLLALNEPGENELHRAALAANELARLYAQVVAELLKTSRLPASDVLAVGVHGQTVRHQPGQYDGLGYTLQINQPALLAELCGIRVVADFRTRDLAAGGQGAPLVPAFHDAVFAQAEHTTVLLNLGGIANISVLPPLLNGDRVARQIAGFDCGPGNALMDAWCQIHTGHAYDADGRWAATGQLNAALLARMLADPYFEKPPPKSTGRDLFNLAWLKQQLAGFDALPTADVQATLLGLTAQSAARAIDGFGAEATEVLVCGGGAYNGQLMESLAQALAGRRVVSTDQVGVAPLEVEAAAFAWLAYRHCHGLPANLPAVTGAQGDRILGASYPA